MKSKYIISVLAILTIATAIFIFENVFSIWEQASYARFRPVTTGLPSAQIARDVQVGEVAADFFTVPYKTGDAKRPLLVVIHGGFFQGGNKKNYAYLGGLGVRSGYVVAIIQLPHFPGIFGRLFFSAEALQKRSLPAQANRVAEFLKSVSALSEQYGFDANKTHIIAHASGALALGEANLKSLKSIVLVSPMLSLTKNISNVAPMQLRALDGFIRDSDALKLSPDAWLQNTSAPVLVLCTERDLPGIKEACKNLSLARRGAKPIERVVVQRPSHFDLMFHLGSKVEDATEPFKKFLFENAKL